MPDIAIDNSRAIPTHSVLGNLGQPQRAAIDVLGNAFREAGGELFLVGGAIRDLLLGLDRDYDLDFATSLTPDLTKRIGAHLRHAGLYDIGERFGTIGIILPAESGDITVEITTFRSEHYEPGSRHPEVAFGTSIHDDLSRRDFTINAIAVDVIANTLVDPFLGRADLAGGLLRAVGNPELRFTEDPLRLLRAARFVSQHGFAIEPDTQAAMQIKAESLQQISRERVLSELTKILCGDYADHALDVLLETGLFTVAMPELIELANSAHGHPGLHREKDLWDHTKRVVIQSPSRPHVRWAALLHDAAKPMTRSVAANGEVHFFGHERVGADLASHLLRRLNADKQTQQSVRRLVDLHLRPAAYDTSFWTDSAVRRLALEAEDDLHDLLDLAAADVTSARAYKQRAAAARVEGLRQHIATLEAQHALNQLQSPLDGNDLMTMFERRPGRWIAQIKDHLRDLVIDGELDPDDRKTAETIAAALLETIE
ncbi:MAG: HD domain-containing protein [Thermomicrobiales bacterium]